MPRQVHRVVHQYGQSKDWPGLTAYPMGNDELFPVCAPALIGRSGGLKTPADLARFTKIQAASPAILRDDWPAWLEHAGIPGLRFASEIASDALYQLYQAAIEGLGVAMGRSCIVHGDIVDGRLVEPFLIRVLASVGYQLVVAPERAKLPKLQTFARWALKNLIEPTAVRPKTRARRP